MSATGSATVDFGTGNTDTLLAITGQSAILSGSMVDAWLVPAVTANNGIDEHWVEDLEVMAGNVIAGTGFTIYAKCRTGKAVGQFAVQWAWL